MWIGMWRSKTSRDEWICPRRAAWSVNLKGHWNNWNETSIQNYWLRFCYWICRARNLKRLKSLPRKKAYHEKTIPARTGGDDHRRRRGDRWRVDLALHQGSGRL